MGMQKSAWPLRSAFALTSETEQHRTLEQGGWWPLCRLLLTPVNITWRTPLSRQAASKFLPLSTEALVLTTKPLQIQTIDPSGLFFLRLKPCRQGFCSQTPQHSQSCSHSPPCTFLGWAGFLPDEFWPCSEVIQRQMLTPQQRGTRMRTKEETRGKRNNSEKLKLLSEHSLGLQTFALADDKSSGQNLFFQMLKMLA